VLVLQDRVKVELLPAAQIILGSLEDVPLQELEEQRGCPSPRTTSSAMWLRQSLDPGSD